MKKFFRAHRRKLKLIAFKFTRLIPLSGRAPRADHPSMGILQSILAGEGITLSVDEQRRLLSMIQQYYWYGRLLTLLRWFKWLPFGFTMQAISLVRVRKNANFRNLFKDLFKILWSRYRLYVGSEPVVRAVRDYGALSSSSLPRELWRNRHSPKKNIQHGVRSRLLFISGMCPSLSHAGGLRVFDIIWELSKTHEIDLFTVYNWKEDSNAWLYLKSRIHRSCRLKSDEQFNSVELRAWLIENQIDLDDYEAIHLEYNHCVRLLPVLSPYNGKIIFTLMENLHRAEALRIKRFLSEGKALDAAEAWGDLSWRMLDEKKLWQFADIRLPITHADGNSCARFFGCDYQVLPTGISEVGVLDHLAKKHIEPLDFTASFVGYFNHQPNREAIEWYMDHVHPLVISRIPQYRFFVVGGGDIEPLIRRNRYPESIIFTGFVEDLTEWIRKSSISVSPLVSGAGFRGKLNQYSVCRRASVSTSIGASGLPYEDGHSIYIADSAELFADRIVHLLTHPDQRKIMADNSYDVAMENFSWPNIVERLRNFYA